MKRSKFKLREKRSRKPYSVNKNVEEYLKFLVRIQFQVINSKGKDDTDNPLRGCFPTKLHYNMDQVTLPLLVNHHSTFTTHEDNDIHISAPLDTLMKRQFTIKLIILFISRGRFDSVITHWEQAQYNTCVIYQ